MLSFESPLKNTLLLLVSGILLTLGWHPYSLVFLVFVAFVPLLHISLNKEESYRWYYALVFFFSWNFTSHIWVKNADWSGVITATFVNTLLMTMVWQGFMFVKKHVGRSRGILGLLTLWLAMEYLTTCNWELAWPWYNLGYSLAPYSWIIQWYEYSGVHGGTLWILLANLVATQVFSRSIRNKQFKAEFLSPLALILILPILSSLIIYSLVDIPETNKVECLAVQPNSDPYNEKFDRSTFPEQVQRSVKLIEGKITDSTRLVILPETAFDFREWENQLSSNAYLQEVFPLFDQHPQAHLIAGITSAKMVEKAPENDRPMSHRSMGKDRFYEVYNAAFHYHSGNPIDFYHKSILLAGVEQLPFADKIPALKKLAREMGGTSGALGKQENRTNFSSGNDGLKVAPVICLESVFGQYVGEFVNNGANVIAILTNDGWWDDTPGYKQHFNYAICRAIEHRRPIVRSANTGRSGIIDQRGTVLCSSDWWKEDCLKAQISPTENLTFYTRYGDLLSRLSIWLGPMFLLYALSMRFRKKSYL